MRSTWQAAALLTIVTTSAAAQPRYAVDESWATVPVEALDLGASAVAALLTDPESMQLRHLSIAPGTDETMLCGEVNAKNRMGGYVGFTPFVASARGAIILPTNGEAEDRLGVEATIVAACPALEPFASQEAVDWAFAITLPDGDVPESIRRYCEEMEAGSGEVRTCINVQLLASVAAKRIMDERGIPLDSYHDCLGRAPKAAGASNLTFVRSCLEKIR